MEVFFRDDRKGGDIMNEEILGIFSGWVEKGKIIRDTRWYKLIFTINKIIVAEEKQSIFRRFTPTIGGGSPDYIVSRASARERMIMQEKSAQIIESILRDSAENFEIPYSDITAVETTSRIKPDYIELFIYMGNLDKPKYNWSVKMSSQYFSDFRQLLETVLPGKV